MPGKVKVKIISGRNLPVMDRSSDTTDAYVEIKLGTTTYKTDVCRKSLHPQWNSEWYRFELDDAELQDEPLQIRLMDHDTYSANDAIGKVYLDLNPLLLPATSLLGKWNDGGNSSHEGNNSVMSGWIPVYDTMHGIRGEVNVIVKVELFTDFNKFRQSSCGVQFFCSPAIPHGFYAQVIHGFVEELVVNDDPEYQWIDKIRTPRASNEARQTLFCKLSGELQRRIGLKALEMGGNAVIGYYQCFDLEGESGIVARGIGTAVTLMKLDLPSPSPANADSAANDERAQGYLKFLGSAKGFHLNNESNAINDNTLNAPQLHSVPLPSPTASFRSLKLENRVFRPEKMPQYLIRHLSSDREFNYPMPIGSEVMQHSVSLQTLLKQEDQRGRPGFGISQRFRNLRFTSQSMITRKMSALKARLTTDENDADAKRPLMKYRRTQSDNTGMAEILIRSVFHATTSLDCIAESPKLGSDEESKDRSFLTLPVASKPQSSPASSLTSIESSDDDDDDDDDEDEDDEEEATGDTIGELDTVSHIVETVRKLSMIQSSIDSGELKYDDNKFLFVIGDAEDQPEVSFDADLEDANLLYYQDVDDEDAKELETESFLPQFVRAFELMRKSATATSLSAAVDLPPGEEKRPMNKKFTSLHNIHASESRWNKYSAHGGKETVLGELFQRIDSAHMLSESELSDYSLDRSHGSVGKSDDINILSDEKVSKQDSREHAVNGLKRTKPLKLIIESRGKTSNVIGHKVDATTAEIKSITSVDSKPEMKRKSKGFLTKKVLKVLHKLDDKIHHKKDKIFHETSQDTNKEHEKILPPKPITSGAQNALSTSSDGLEKERINKVGLVDSPPLSSSLLSEDISQHSSGSDEHKHGLLHKLKHAPMDLIHKLDTKIHEVGHHNEKGGIKNEHGLLNIALGNVLMDSVQEVLVTSHTASPNDCPPVFPIIQDETPRETIDLPHESSLISKDSHRKSEDFKTLSKSEETDHKHGIFEKIKEGKDRILHSNIIHKIDNKIHNLGHHEDKSGIKHEHGLLNIALGNVLMDSVQEVLATSHSASPNANPPEFPALQSSEVPLNTSERPHPMLPQLGRPGSHSHVIGFDRRDSQYTPSASAIEEESVNQAESLRRHNLLDKFKENKETVFLRIDSKDSVTSHSEPENDKIVTPELSPHTEKPRPMLRLFSRPEFIPQVIDLEGNEEKSSSELPLLKEHVDQQESPRRQSLLDKLKDGKDKLLHHPKDLFHKKGSKGHSDLDTFHSPTMSSAPGSPVQSQKTSEENITQTGKDKKHGILNLLKEGKHKLFHRPKELFHRLDSKIHDDKAGIKEEHGLINIALGNVLMDSVQEVLATSHSASPKSESESPQFTANTSERAHPKLPQLGRQGSHSHVLELKDGPEHFTPTEPEIIEDDELEFEQPSGVENLIKLDSPTSVTSHNLLGKLKEGKEKLLSGPKELFHCLDSKMHDDKSSIKNEHGLINIALGNVLMDSVQEVLATSHSALPKSELETPEFPSNTSERPHPKLPQLGREGSYSHVLELKDGPEPFTPKELEIVEVDELETNIPFSEIPGNLESSPGTSNNLLENLKGGKEKLLHGPKELFHRLDSKVHDTGSPGIKKEHGLLNIALSNILMDSVEEVLATSHSETPTPEALPNLSLLPPQVPSQLDSNLLPSLNPSEASSNLLSIETIDQVNNPNNANSLVVGVNTEVDSGHHDCINTMHACLTTHRNVETPVPTPISTVVTTTTMITTTTTAATPIESGTRTENGHQRTESLGVRISHSPAKINAIPCIHRRSSDSDLSITPKGILRKRNSLTGSDRSGGYSSGQYMRGAMLRTTRPQENFDIMEYPFLTLSKYPAGFIAHIGGSVSARSVKLLERISNIEEPESRDTWWSEIRMEIRSHARALNCNAVLGYTESTSICDDVCVLSASGTAAVLCLQHHTTGEASDNVSGLPVLPKNNANTTTMTTSLDRNDFEKDKEKDKEKPKVEEKLPSNGGTGNNNSSKAKVVPVNGTTGNTNSSPEREAQNVKPSCSLSHLPYTSNSKPLRSSSIKCYTCGAHKVPDMLIATIEMPDGMPNFGRGCFIQSYVCRPLKDLKGESNAKEISDGLPFLEYELHRFLINKLKVKGMNAIFGLKVRISIGERMLIGIATGTAVFLSSLPPPLLPKLVSDRTTDEKKLTQLQKNLHDTIKKNREIYQLFAIEEVNGETSKLNSESDDSEEETATLDLAMGNKDCCVLEVDDPDDVDVLNSLMEPRPPDGFHVVNTEHVPGLEDLEIVKNLQMFTQIWRAKIPAPFNLDKHFHRLLQSVYFKLRRMIPCALCDLQFRVDSPEPDEIQLCVLGMALGLGDPFKGQKKRKIVIPKRNDDELIFNLEEDQIPENSVVQTPPTHLLQAQSLKYRQKSPVRNKLTKQRHVPYRERHGVDITPLSYVPGGKIEKYLGNLNFFLIRETTSLREEGGLSGFIHSFVTEILAIVRAHVTALGGNAMVAYFITECVLNHNLHKNQGQCLINVGGDVVYVSYFTEDH